MRFAAKAIGHLRRIEKSASGSEKIHTIARRSNRCGKCPLKSQRRNAGSFRHRQSRRIGSTGIGASGLAFTEMNQFSHTCGERNGGAAESARLNAPAKDREPNNKRTGSASLKSATPKAEHPTAHEPKESDRLLSNAPFGLTRKAGSNPEVQLKQRAMNCPKCGTKISDRAIARQLASKGGKTTGKTKARDSNKMREAALKRWSEARALNAKKGGWPKGRKRK